MSCHFCENMTSMSMGCAVLCATCRLEHKKLVLLAKEVETYQDLFGNEPEETGNKEVDTERMYVFLDALGDQLDNILEALQAYKNIRNPPPPAESAN